MQFDLDNMSRSELEHLRVAVEKAIKSVDVRELQKAREAAERAAAEHGFTLADLTGGVKTRKSSGPVKAKYRNPADATQTWSGRGRKPQWIKDAEEAGTDLESLAI